MVLAKILSVFRNIFYATYNNLDLSNISEVVITQVSGT